MKMIIKYHKINIKIRKLLMSKGDFYKVHDIY